MFAYQAVLSDGDNLIYDTKAIVASDTDEAGLLAKSWARTLDVFPELSWLIIRKNGVGLTTFSPGDF
jgi:hypothetical protein